MMPGVRVHLDVDDLEEIGKLIEYLQRCGSMLVYCSQGCALCQGSILGASE